MDQPITPVPPSAPAAATAPAALQPALTSATELLRQSWLYYKAHLRRLLGITLTSWIIIAVATILAGVTGVVSMGTTGAKPNPVTPATGIILLVYIVVVIIASCWQYVSLIYAITPEGETKNWKEVYKTSKRWLWTYLAVAIVSGILTMIGFVLLIIPGIVLATWFSLAVFAVVNENLSPIAALKASRHYVKGRFSAVLGRWVLFILVAIGISILIGIVGALFGDTVKSLLNLLFSLFLTPFAAVYGMRLYQTIRQSHT